MSDGAPEVGDRVLYRGVYREVVGFEQDGEIVVYQNPETERNTYSRTEDLERSDHFGAWYPVGLLLSRAECVIYAAHPSTASRDVPPAGSHEQAARMLEEVDLDEGAMEAVDREVLDRKVAGYWPDDPPPTEELFDAARRLRAHREQEG